MQECQGSGWNLIKKARLSKYCTSVFANREGQGSTSTPKTLQESAWKENRWFKNLFAKVRSVSVKPARWSSCAAPHVLSFKEQTHLKPALSDYPILQERTSFATQNLGRLAPNQDTGFKAITTSWAAIWPDVELCKAESVHDSAAGQIVGSNDWLAQVEKGLETNKWNTIPEFLTAQFG